MGDLTIGSNALKFWFREFPRVPGDLDIWAPQRPEWTESVPDEDFKVDLFWDDRLQEIVGDHSRTADPDEILTIKVSHSPWELKNGSWRKHMHDIVWLQDRGARFLPDLYKLLYPIWEDRHGKKPVNLNLESGYLLDEVWKVVPGYPNHQVSSSGKCRGPRGEMKGCPATGPIPYVQYNLVGKTFLAHRLVMEAFVGPCPEGMQVRHLDGDYTNNDISNLAYGTPRENAEDKQRHGTTVRGERHPLSKLTEESVALIRALYAAGDVTQRDLAEKFGVAPSLVSRVIKGQSWKEERGFFQDAVQRIYDHDSVHRSVAYTPGFPIYDTVLKDGKSVAMDMKKVWALPFAEQVRLFREEIYATALERWAIPTDYEISPKLAYAMALRKTITSLTKGRSALFMILNYKIFRDPDMDYVQHHLDNRHYLERL